MQELSQMHYQYRIVYHREVYWGHFFFNFFFINDLPNHISKCKISLCADNKVIICAGKTAEEVQISLQHDLNCALEWFKANHLHLNVKKTKWSLVGTYQKLGKATEINITVNDRVDEYKCLGMIFDKNLNWHNHIDKMCAKISRL